MSEPPTINNQPANLFAPSGRLRDPNLETSTHSAVQSRQTPVSRNFDGGTAIAVPAQSGDLDVATGAPESRPDTPGAQNLAADGDDSYSLYNDRSDSDAEMADAASSFSDRAETETGETTPATQPEDILESVPNLFRLLDLVDEHGSGGIVEKIIIDQRSLHRLLNIVHPGAYNSVSKINFKALDKLAIKPTGLYGNRAEIVKFLQEVNCLDEKSASLLSDILGPEGPTSALRSGLYLVLRSNLEHKEASKTAYIIYWPEDTTWDDQAASSSVRRNRVTFMRYLTKLADQIIALVSPSQARAFVWDTGARNKDLPEDQQDNDDDARLFSFEVSKSLEQDEDAIATPGFRVTVDGRHLPRGGEAAKVELVPGEQKAALLVLKRENAQTENARFEENINAMSLAKMIGAKDYPLQLGKVSADDLSILAANGLRKKHESIFDKYDRRMRELNRGRSSAEAEDKKHIEDRIKEDKPKVWEEVQNIVRTLYDGVYPSLHLEFELSHSPEMSAILHRRYPALGKVLEDLRKRQKVDVVADKEFQALKLKWFVARDFLKKNSSLPESELADFVNDVLNGKGVDSNPDPRPATSGQSGSWWSSTVGRVWSIGVGGGSSGPAPYSTYGANHAYGSKGLKDPEFVNQLRPLERSFPVLSELTRRIFDCLRREVENLEKKVLRDQVDRILSAERHRQTIAASTARDYGFQDDKSEAFRALITDLERAMETSSQCARRVDWVRPVQTGPGRSYYGNGSPQFRWSGTRISLCPAQDRYIIYPLELTEQDSQMCRTDEAHIPQPKLETRHKFEFTVAEGRSVEFLHLVRDKCLAVVSGSGRTRIYIEDNVTLDHAINKTHGKVSLNHDSLGGSRCLFAFDQSTRLFAILHGQKELRLSIYIFDELFANLRSRGSPIPLKNWYESSVDICKVCFVSGIEEICLIEAAGRVRIFSLVTQQFRNANLQINRPIVDAFPAPDGSCLLIAVAGRGSMSPQKLLAFHWASFGSNKHGIDSTELPPSDALRVATRFEGRGRIHVISFAAGSRTIISKALQVKQKATEFSFRSDREHHQNAAAETFNNSLIDCHLEVWTRFPVVPAVARNTLSPIVRQPRKLIFVSPVVLAEAEAYFSRMISTFESTTRKPMGGTLSAIKVSSGNMVGSKLEDEVSEFRLGSFIVELLCLIPLHLAVTRENRFIPLKDGVWDPDYERSLLGADVPTIIDALSLGWYESLFQSYMATKPVRVVSSMGEQSVGKSYCLNHFADTSFAGSAMRTTEGVWLSCTPTESYLLVSLDFEGVHSIERSAQEDALLVLFNTAISNLVLFRNNFAMSRDIAGLFTSFQSSATVLDPNVNRGLFNSTLAIIIKDVTNADAKDIVKEFSLKFQGIVEKEKDQNFISRLHRGRIQIIPWPVINSPNFYTLFLRLRQQLDKQRFTHNSGGAFLHNLKTLMAKIKTSDWGSLDQNLAAHRAQQLMDRLPGALCYGRLDEGPLKNMDTDEELPTPDHMPPFFVPDFSGGDAAENEALAEQALGTLVQICGPTPDVRFQMGDAAYFEVLQKGIHEALDNRLSLVQQWLTVNVERFLQGNQDIRNLLGKLNTAALAMRTATRLCSVGCSSCQLLCLRTYRHSGDHSCGTNHQCVFDCEVAEEHAQREPCGLPAGHGGRHMCDVRAHSCGSECHLSKMGGCAQSCIKPLDHDGDHMCSARAHLCGKPCGLRNVKQGRHGAIYSCPGTCDAPWDEPHTQHACDNARACPIECTLCRRLCCNTDHFHGLDSNAVHLCGQEHNCLIQCEADGICQVETRPSAIQEQFSGRHESFMYTRYTQVAKRLSCVIPIPPGELSHEGAHTHDTADDAFHYCDARCPNCEYVCTLPLGHPQQLHETSHGSMITTQWVLQPDDDDANPVYELQGRKFGSGDEGAPMLCSLVCAAQGRHAHIDYCRDPANCDNTDCEHIAERMHPGPDRQKDWVSHATYWARSGFKDPYSNDEQLDFAKCDILCAGPEHEATATAPANPSYCTLPIFHAPQAQQPAPAVGHVSRDGHSFDCQNPSRLHQAYHIVFVIDSSGSMLCTDRGPLPNTPISARLASQSNNRYGAVLSALYGFWLSRDTVASSSVTQMRQDAYSVITFDHYAITRLQNDFGSATDDLIGQLIPQMGCGGTDFQAALTLAQSLIENNWSSDRAPVIVFLSDGECNIADNPVYDLCHLCVRLGKALAFYSVSFGTDACSASLRRMAEIAHEVYASAPQDVLSAARGNPCTYTNAIDSIQLADTFLGIANSLQKPRASLMSQFGSGGRRAIY